MSDETGKNPESFQADKNKPSEPSDNPLARGFDVTVSIPEAFEIRMVDASILSDYEVWFFICSILSNAVIGFLVAYLQSKNSNPDTSSGIYLIVTIVFAILFFIALMMTLAKRDKIRKKSKDIKLRATEVITKDNL